MFRITTSARCSGGHPLRPPCACAAGKTRGNPFFVQSLAGRPASPPSCPDISPNVVAYKITNTSFDVYAPVGIFVSTSNPCDAGW
eukprot:1196078-Prorocentrum_minimum.AAC.5